MTPLTPDDVLGLARVDALGRLRSSNAVMSQWCAGRQRLDQLFPGLDLLPWLQESQDRGWQALDMIGPGGSTMPVMLRLEASGSAEHWLALRLRGQAEERLAIDGLQRAVLEAVASDQPLAELMSTLCLRVEALCPGVRCSVLRIDEERRLRTLAGPSLPEAYGAAIDGVPIGEAVGSCGTAAFRGSAVDVADIATDPLWADYREMARDFGLHACWSNPVRLGGPDARVVATFALYYRDAARIEPFVRQLVDACLHLVAVALRRDEARHCIERLAHYDSVTGLPNQRLLELRLQAVSGGSALLLLGLDRFQGVNEAMGQTSGDLLLRAVGERLQQTLGSDGFVARVGGDEFALLVHGSQQHHLGSEAARIAKRLRSALDTPLPVADQIELRMGASIGIALGEDGQDGAELLAHARLALREAKAAGRSALRFFLTQSHRELEERLQLESLLDRAASAGELSLVFQPKISLSDRGIVGAEALLRWHNGVLGAVAPDRFIALAEESGLIQRLDAWVCEQALHSLAAWEREGLLLPNLSINVSAHSLADADYAQHLLATLARQGLAPQRLTLEVTERAVVAESGALQRLHEAGVRIAVDDFGTGYSSLSYLRSLPVQELKLDRAFVVEVASSARDQALVGALVKVGKAMGCEVVAEGVETTAQLERLARLGCGAAQGYGIARPMAERAFLNYLRRPVLAA